MKNPQKDNTAVSYWNDLQGVCRHGIELQNIILPIGEKFGKWFDKPKINKQKSKQNHKSVC